MCKPGHFFRCARRAVVPCCTLASAKRYRARSDLAAASQTEEDHPMLRKHLLACTILSFSASLIAFTATAQGTYPSRPIKIIAPVQPGGGVDLVARQVGDRLS